MRTRNLLPFFVLFTLFFTGLSHAGLLDGVSSNEDEFLPVEEAYQLNVEFDNGQTVLIWTLADSYYLYRHGFQHQWITDGSTLDATAQIPGGIEKEDEYFGQVEVYYQQLAIYLDTPESKRPLRLKVSSQGCADAGLCYPPYHLYFMVDPANQTAVAISADQYRAAQQPTDASASATTTPPVPMADSQPPGLLWILLAAMIGGMILNLMPCVLPVLSMKVMQLARKHDERSARIQGLAYMTGVISSFVAIAAVMLSLRASGDAVGWGFQLQSPWFVAAMAYLFFALGLSMIGVFHIGQRWMGAGQELTQKQGLQGSFFTGVLAVVVASPCTAPFMGSALGYAVTQSPAVALLTFAALGLGMALPLTLISFIPAAARLLPKPGLWMERLKQFFAFPLFATAVWLLWVLGNQAGTNAMAMILLGCIAMGMAFWCFQSAGGFSRACGLILLIGALTLPFSEQLRNPTALQQPENHEAFSQARLTELRQQGQAVFVDLTADWCITCLANEKSTLETDEIQQAFHEAGIIYMVGDWTHFNPEISALLSEYQRSGIPLYLLYPPIPDAPAVILPQILNKQIVLDAIENNM